jgi:phage tail-like protein
MAILRERPYCNHNFLVDLGTGAPNEVRAGFSEVSGLSAELEVIDYRNGNDRENTLRKAPGVARFSEVTLKRGVIGSTDLWQWFKAVSDGNVERRTVTIQLLSEDRSAVVMTWRLLRAFPTRYSGPTLTASGSETAIESLTLVHEGLELE